MTLTLLLTFALIAATVAPSFRLHLWWLRIFDFPRLYIASLAFVVVFYALFFAEQTLENQIAVLLLSAIIAWQGTKMAPFTKLHAKEIRSVKKSKNSMALMTANLRMGNKRWKDFLRLVELHKPEVLLIIENNFWWSQQLKSLEKTYPYRIEQPQENTYGISLYSQLPIKRSEVRFLIDENVPSIYARLQLTKEEHVDFYGVHPRPPAPFNRIVEKDAEILKVSFEVKRTESPAIVCGDLNDVGWSRITKLFKKNSGLLDPRVGRGFFNTYNAFIPLFRYPIDHVFLSEHFRVIQLQRLKKFGSDHFPILTRIAFLPEEKNRIVKQEGLDQKEKKEVKETVEKAVS